MKVVCEVDRRIIKYTCDSLVIQDDYVKLIRKEKDLIDTEMFISLVRIKKLEAI